MIPGFFQTNLFPEDFFPEDLWQDTGLDTSNIHIFSDIMTAPIYLTDNGDNVFVQGGIEAREISYFNGAEIFGDVEISGGLTVPTVTTSQIFDTDDNLKIDVNNEALIDTAADLSIDWEDRRLYAPLGVSAPILDWRTAGLADFGDSKIVTTGVVGIGTDDPQAGLHYVGTNGISLFSSTEDDETTKQNRMGVPHWDNSEQPFLLLLAQSTETGNILDIGGGTALGNAATAIKFYTALGNTTTTGVVRMRIKNDGDVGIGVNPAQKFEIGSNDNTDRISIYHDNTNAYFRTDDGDFRFITAEGTNTDSVLNIIGKGTGDAVLQMNNETVLRRASTVIESIPGASIPWRLFNNSTKGETQRLRIAGFKDGDEKRTADLRISSIEDDTFRITGVSNYRFDGHVKSTDLTVDGTVVMMANLPGADPSNAGQLWVDSSSGDVIKVSQG